MNEPTTAAGRALLELLGRLRSPDHRPQAEYAGLIRQIESEAEIWDRDMVAAAADAALAAEKERVARLREALSVAADALDAAGTNEWDVYAVPVKATNIAAQLRRGLAETADAAPAEPQP